MSELKLEGKLVAVFDKQQVTDSFAKREFVIETDDQYPQTVKFELTQNKCDDIEAHKVGDDLVVHFNVRGRKWHNQKKNEDVYFVTLNAWRLESQSNNTTASDTPPPSESDIPPVDDGMADDLPF